jgi:hypothetical protein
MEKRNLKENIMTLEKQQRAKEIIDAICMRSDLSCTTDENKITVSEDKLKQFNTYGYLSEVEKWTKVIGSNEIDFPDNYDLEQAWIATNTKKNMYYLNLLNTYLFENANEAENFAQEFDLKIKSPS